ncbi:hypothetical protein GORBP_048_00060 [Gordonia rubripertincta NBRC 101908]|uniref:Transposase n=1 Tax=Gordonia rubripertincta NBRC 101908 TaxID=1077975 RepID=A0ABQ0HRD8_GORRU|nr:hypothetical protein GORBP_048_00060 [Gordonia rubripertincta NBRC 101908]
MIRITALTAALRARTLDTEIADKTYRPDECGPADRTAPWCRSLAPRRTLPRVSGVRRCGGLAELDHGMKNAGARADGPQPGHPRSWVWGETPTARSGIGGRNPTGSSLYPVPRLSKLAPVNSVGSDQTGSTTPDPLTSGRWCPTLAAQRRTPRRASRRESGVTGYGIGTRYRGGPKPPIQRLPATGMGDRGDR